MKDISNSNIFFLFFPPMSVSSCSDSSSRVKESCSSVMARLSVPMVDVRVRVSVYFVPWVCGGTGLSSGLSLLLII